ncbi:hypothetical protein N9R26_01480 [Flavobacteriaceae bacterium]|nr:hypothetical protein [Flavobacteriaceae bacterium]MDA9374884.1 hypothetical protein [Flavobacteriaceae bacterium]MDB4014649.1 hypothetical protein [Flavobacteriaceae bacterium]
MNKIISIIFFLIVSNLGAQDLKWDNTVEGDFIIDSVNLGPNGDVNNVSVSGKAGNWTVYMTYYFTNKLETEGQGEYTAMAWAQDGSERLKTTVQGLWKQNDDNYELKHFENGSDGSQLLTTGLMNFETKTYNCLVRFLN